MPKKGKIGSIVYVQACARMMSAAWIRRQIRETSTSSGMSISGIAYALGHTVASDIGIGFELAIKSLAQGLSPNEDGKPQVLYTHNLIDLWNDDDIGPDVRSEIDADAECGVCNRYGTGNAGKALAFADYLAKHEEFLNRIDNRYAMSGDTRWKSDHRFLTSGFSIAQETYNDKTCVDGIGILMAYWWAIMRKAHKLRWPDDLCANDEGLALDRDEAWKLTQRTIGQMFGNMD